MHYILGVRGRCRCIHTSAVILLSGGRISFSFLFFSPLGFLDSIIYLCQSMRREVTFWGGTYALYGVWWNGKPFFPLNFEIIIVKTRVDILKFCFPPLYSPLFPFFFFHFWQRTHCKAPFSLPPSFPFPFLSSHTN